VREFQALIAIGKGDPEHDGNEMPAEYVRGTLMNLEMGHHLSSRTLRSSRKDYMRRRISPTRPAIPFVTASRSPSGTRAPSI
jgi:hypothetical protein